MNKFLSARKGFYKELFVLVIPIVVQNLIASSVSVADTLMLGNVDQTSLSASGLAGQLMFLINVMFFGLNSAITILASQYWGKKDEKVISKILGIGLIISMVVTVSFSALAFLTRYEGMILMIVFLLVMTLTAIKNHNWIKQLGMFFFFMLVFISCVLIPFFWWGGYSIAWRVFLWRLSSI